MISEYFLDESGNTGDLARPGSRFDFGQQEVFVLSCLGVGDVSALGDELNRLKNVHRVRAPELKSSSLRDKPGLVADLADYIKRARLPLMTEVVDKRFMIAANMINTIVMPPVGDVDQTPKAQWLRNVMAEYMHARAPASVFEAFVAACDAPSGASLAKAFLALFTWLKGETRDEVSYGIGRSVADSFDEFNGIGPQTGEAQKRFLPLQDIGKRGQSIWMLPNLTSFTNIYARLNRFHERKIGSITLYHDEQSHFDNLLHDAKQTAEGLARAGGAPPMRFADYTFEEEARLVFLESHASPGIQAADVLAGFLMRYVKDALFGRREPSDESKFAFRRILELSEPTEGQGTNFVLSTADVVRLGVVPA